MTVVSIEADDTAMDAALAELTLEHGLRHERTGTWATDVPGLPPLGEVVASRRGDRLDMQVIRREEGVLRLRLQHGRVFALLASPTPADVDALMAIVRHQIPARARSGDEQRVRMDFWSNATPEPVRITRLLEVPRWSQIAGNYGRETRHALAGLLDAKPPLAGGRLLLWNGPPGTGKTNALRALAWEWRDDVSVQYVTDPEQLLTHPTYGQRLLLGDRGSRWRLIVLEDAGELLAPDAKQRAGQGLARLLNLTDGLVGQGSKTLVLITGNEPLDRFHPAVSRPGRCAASVGFDRFDAAAGAAWLAERTSGPVELPTGATSLAELYARLEGRQAPAPERAFGFA